MWAYVTFSRVNFTSTCMTVYVEMRSPVSPWPISRTSSYSLLYPKAMVGWERRMWKRRPRVSAWEHLRIEIQVHSNLRWCVNIPDLLAEDVMFTVALNRCL